MFRNSRGLEDGVMLRISRGLEDGVMLHCSRGRTESCRTAAEDETGNGRGGGQSHGNRGRKTEGGGEELGPRKNGAHRCLLLA
jgi:hypothetical protein